MIYTTNMATATIIRLAPALLSMFFCFATVSSYSQKQVLGCKDPYATNYNPDATVNDGKCAYNTTTYTPPVKVNMLDNRLKETSGLQWAGDYLWSFNDSGGDAAIYRVDTSSGVVLQTVFLQNATNIDWEDIAFDGTYLYVGDIGNNVNGARADLKIYKFKFSDIPADYATNDSVTIPANQIEIIHYKYSNQPLPLVATTYSNTTSFDCEAMIVDGGKIHLFTKDWIGNTSVHYVINSTNAGTYNADSVEMLPAGFLITGADKVAGKDIVALIGYQNSGFGNHYIYLLSDFSGGNYFNGNKRKIDLPSAAVMGQAEGITFKNATDGFISNEEFSRSIINVSQKLRSFSIADFVPMYVLPLELKSFSVVQDNDRLKISWWFAAPVRNVKIQGSSDGIAFADLKTYSTSTTDVYYYTPTAVRCYRLAWQKANGAYIYSDIVCVKGNSKSSFSNIWIKANGQLNFTINGNAPVRYAFNLLTTDGKMLAQLREQSYMPGAYSVSFSKDLPASNYVFLVAYNNAEKRSLKLWVRE